MEGEQWSSEFHVGLGEKLGFWIDVCPADTLYIEKLLEPKLRLPTS